MESIDTVNQTMPAGADTEIIKWLATLGIGGILAAFIFMFYRKDVRSYTDLWKTTADQLIVIVKENTESNTKLVTLIDQMLKENNFNELKVLRERMERLEREAQKRVSSGASGR